MAFVPSNLYNLPSRELVRFFFVLLHAVQVCISTSASLIGVLSLLVRSLQELFIHDAAARLSNDAERERLDQVQRSLDRLDTALLRLDENLMFFNTF